MHTQTALKLTSECVFDKPLRHPHGIIDIFSVLSMAIINYCKKCGSKRHGNSFENA